MTSSLHQVRIHLHSFGCPILGDELYAPKSKLFVSPRLALHAHRLVFKHPTTGKMVDVKSPWSKDVSVVLKKLGFTMPDAAKAPLLDE